MAILERGRRARSDEQKRTRLDSILDVAWRLFQERPYDEITMALVAEQTLLAKGTLYLYVNSKEALFLTVLDRHLGLWFDAIHAEAGAVGGAWTTEQAVDFSVLAANSAPSSPANTGGDASPPVFAGCLPIGQVREIRR